MAKTDVPQELIDALNFAAAAIPLVSALAVMAAHAEAAYAAVRQSNNAATLDLATTASSAMLILGGQPSQPAPTSKSVEKMLSTLISQSSAAPVVT